MTDATALLAAIRAAPEDDAPRLVYADWLEEHGQPEKAELIRLQCELARNESAELRRRETALLAESHDTLAGSLAVAGLRYVFHRGFAVGFGHTGLFVNTVSRSPAHHWTHLRFMPNGLLGLFGLDEEPEAAAAWIRELGPRWAFDPYSARYFLDPTSDPATVRIFLSKDATSDSANSDRHGVFSGTSLSLYVADSAEPTAQFSHYPIPGFDSFSET
jgi:uncharacterized protein (TIGR02996 family)